MAEHAGNAGLFGVFLLSLYFLLLGAWTLWRCCGDEAPESPEDWQERKRKSAFKKKLKKYLTAGNIVTVVLWIVGLLLVFFVQQGLQDSKPFDPYEILEIPRTATEKEIQKAYRNLARKYHPDKNPDPEATKYFAEKIKPAHEALSNPVARENWEKYGHPDGQQTATLDIALPSFLFSKDKKTGPILLLLLVGGGILLPLGVVSYYVLSSKQYTGPNRIMNETMFYYLYSVNCVKESQGVVRIPETLLCAAEFVNLPTPAQHEPALDEMRKLVLMYHSDLNPKEKPKFWKRKASVIKANLLLLLHLQREGAQVPAILQNDLKFVLNKAIPLLHEIFNIATYQKPPYGYGWMCPAVASVEMLQHLIQAVPIEERKPSNKGESAANLLQLPHFSKDLIKKLSRDKTTPVRSLKDLQDLSSTEVEQVLSKAGMNSDEVDAVITHLQALPQIHVWCECFVEGEDDILEMDQVRCNVRIVLTRPSHTSPAFTPKNKPVLALAPHFPGKHEEGWVVMLTEPGQNWLMAESKIALVEAETIGYNKREVLADIVGDEAKKNGIKRASSSSGLAGAIVPQEEAEADEEKVFGQVEELMFLAPRAGRYELQLLVMSDSYFGCDKVVKVPFRVQLQRRAPAAEAPKAKTPKVKDQDKEDKADDKAEGSSNDNSDSDAYSDDDGSEEWDSEETGTEVSDDEDDDDKPDTSAESSEQTTVDEEAKKLK